jgi:hypothetical protein
MERKKVNETLKIISKISFWLGSAFIIVVLLSGGKTKDYWAALWQKGNKVGTLSERALVLFLVSFICLVLIELIKNEKE